MEIKIYIEPLLTQELKFKSYHQNNDFRKITIYGVEDKSGLVKNWIKVSYDFAPYKLEDLNMKREIMIYHRDGKEIVQVEKLQDAIITESKNVDGNDFYEYIVIYYEKRFAMVN